MIKREDAERDVLLKDTDFDLIEEFYKDFASLIWMIKKLKAGSEGDNEYYKAIDVFGEYVGAFNAKYPGLKIKLTDDMDRGMNMQIFFPEEDSLVKLFINSLSKVEGLHKLGTDPNDLVEPTPESVRDVIKRAKNKLILFFHRGSSKSVMLELDPKEKVPELIFDYATIDDPENAEFVLCAHYAIKTMKKEEDISQIRFKFPPLASFYSVDAAGALSG